MYKKLACIIMLFSLICSFVVPTYASTTPPSCLDDVDKAIVLYPRLDGSYSTEYVTEQENMQRGGLGERLVVRARDSGNQVFFDEKTPSDIYMRVNSTTVIPADEINVTNITNIDIQAVVTTYKLSERLAQDLYRIEESYTLGELEIDNLCIYIPSNALATRSVSTRTYTGYNGRQYYEELLILSGNSTTFNVVKPNYGAKTYSTNVMAAFATTLLNNALDTVSGNTWSLASVLAQSPGYSSIPTNAAVTHTAALIENKYRRYTYIYEGSEHYFGSLLDYTSSYRFKDYINIPGYDILEGEYTPIQRHQTAYYYEGDRLAYQWYGNGGYTDTVTGYVYKNSNANLETTVDSLF